MKGITSLTVTYDDGSKHTFDGTGFLQTASAQEKPANGGMAKVIGTQVTANLLIPKEES